MQRDRPLAPSARYRLADCDVAVLGRGTSRARAQRSGRELDIRVDDPWMSSTHARLVREAKSFVLEDSGSRNGTARNGATVSRCTLADGDVIEVGRSFFLFRSGAEFDTLDAEESNLSPIVGDIVTLSPSFADELARFARVASTDLSVIVLGETGTGKEVLSQAMHALSGRTGRFVAINCAALPDALVQSELFGHKKGAFSGAVDDRPGLVRSADGGTLLLDEIGDLGPTGQGALLRVLQEREVLALGSHRPVGVDVRVVSATHRDLETLAASGTFRSDLLARLSDFVFRVPALRSRREDLGILLRSFIRQRACDPNLVTLSQDATRALLAHDWPLNVRELEKCVAAALAQAVDGAIQAAHLPATVKSSTLPSSKPAERSSDRDAQRREQLVALLEEHAGNVSAVARSMDAARAQIHRWLRKYELDPAAFRR